MEYYQDDHPILGDYRSGAICNDGWVSSSTGRGACSHHGGVDFWTYPQIGYHYLNPYPYWMVVICASSIIAFASIVSYSFRRRTIAFSSEILHGIGGLSYSAIFIASIPILIIRFLFEDFIAKKRAGPKN
jgi:hypothetical protein